MYSPNLDSRGVGGVPPSACPQSHVVVYDMKRDNHSTLLSLNNGGATATASTARIRHLHRSR
jgi:hypothetical protein